MKAALLVLAAGAWLADAAAAPREFPGCAWSETRVERAAGRLRVVDARGRALLGFVSEGGDFLDRVVVSNAADRLVVDARAAFAAGMKKLVVSSHDIGPADYAGGDCTLVTTLDGPRGSELLEYFEGFGPAGHYYRSRPMQTKGHRRDYPFLTEVAAPLQSLHLRWDILDAKGPVGFLGARYGRARDLPLALDKPHVEPELLFHAPFDGSAEAAFARGVAAPRQARGLAYADGVDGQAVRLTAAAGSVLEYAAADNLVPERGTVAFWMKREWPDDGRTADGGEVWRTLFANPDPKGARSGSGQLWFWWWGRTLRADTGDDEDSYRCWRGAAPSDGWNHVAVVWDESGARLYLNGRDDRSVPDSLSPMAEALKTPEFQGFSRETFASFFVGCRAWGQQLDGLVDDLRIYSAPLAPAAIRDLYRRGVDVEIAATGRYGTADTPGSLVVRTRSLRRSARDLARFAYCLCATNGTVVARFDAPVSAQPAELRPKLPAGVYRLCVTDGASFLGDVSYTVFRRDNPYTLAPRADDRPGLPRRMELVETRTLDGAPDPARFRAVGPTAVRRLGGVPYLEAGERAGDRFAVRFRLPDAGLLWCFEIDYPDDRVRTADLIVQKSGSPWGDYTLQVGYAAGDEYANTGRILTHRCLYWASDPDVTLVAMTARDGAPAAVSAVRVYRVPDDALPAAAVNAPPARPGEWRRTVGLYFEDPSIGYEFAVPKSDGYAPDDLENLIDRTAALMKYTGEDLLAYPGAWYHGLIGEDYNPRHHAPDFLSAWYAKFDAEGLGLMPTVNPNTMPVPEGLVTRLSMRDGSLHASPVAIHDTGRPNWGRWHDTPPNFNFDHPDVQRYIAEMVDALVEQGVRHPSFRGVCLHLTRHCLLWFGDEESGYNDYTVAAFARAKGLEIPVDRGDPARGRAYAQWLRAHAWEDWLQWRCDRVTAFYAQLAARLAARRGDLRLWLNCLVPANVHHPDFGRPDFMARANRACGLDPAALTARAPNLILGQTLVPADYRWRPLRDYPNAAARAHQRVLDAQPGFYALLADADYPWVHQHDRYWESPIGGEKGPGLSCDWLRECGWRVSTINPSGVHALRPFVLPLRYGDVLGLSKGGFLIGTYGMEDVLVPFVQAFRALPAVRFGEAGGDEVVKLRAARHGGRSWFYLVNTGDAPRTVTAAFPPGTRDCVTGEALSGDVALTLAPYQLRSFSAPAGRPALRSVGE